MQTGELLLKLKEVLPADEIGDVARSINQDSLVRDTLTAGDFLSVFTDYAKSNQILWNIGGFALCAIDFPDPGSLGGDPLPPLSADVRQKASLDYQRAVKSGTPPVTLADAASIALALRERRRLTGSWAGMVDEIIRANSSHQFVSSCWKTIFSILFSWFEQNPQLLAEYKSTADSLPAADYYGFLSAILLSQALSFPEQLHVFQLALAEEDFQHVVSWLSHLATIHPQLTRELARDLIKTNQADSSGENSPAYNDYLQSLAVNSRYSDPLVDDFADPDFSTIDLWLNLYELAGADDQYSALLLHKNTLLQGLLGRIQANHLRKTVHPKGVNPWIDISHNLTSSALALAEMVLSGVPEGSNLIELDDQLKTSDHPLCLLARSVIARAAGDQESANLFAQSAASSPRNYSSNLADLARLRNFLHQLGYINLAGDLSRALSQNSSFIAEYNIWLAEDQLLLGDFEGSLLSAESVLLFDPANRAARRVYARALQQAGRPEDALAQWEIITGAKTGLEPPSNEEWLEYAQAAMSLKDTAKAAAICTQLMQNNQPDARFLTLSGDISMAQGATQPALNAYEQALAVDPSIEQPWLALAGYYASQGDSAKSIDILRSGLHTCPESSAICTMLGDQYAAIGAYTDALPYTMRSLELEPANVNLIFKAGSMLQLVGKTSSALSIYRKALDISPNHPGLLQAYATALIASGDQVSAYEPLLVLVAQKPGQITPYLDLVSSAIAVYKLRGDIDLQKIQEYLHAGLEIQPDHPLALLLDADLNTLLGRYSLANTSYRALAESPLLTEDMRWRINYGIGLTSAHLGQVDTALAALEEAGNLNPKNYEIQQKLAETYLVSGLQKAALDAAQLALSILPEDTTNLLWYSDFCQKSGDIPEAISALQSAITQQPQNITLHLQLGSLQIKLGEKDAAVQTFTRLVDEGKLSSEQVKEAAARLAEEDLTAEAIQLLHNSIQQDPANALSLLMDLASYEKKDGNAQRAIAAIEQAIQLDSTDINLILQKVDLLAFAGDTSNALAVLQNLLDGSAAAAAENAPDITPYLATIHLRKAFLHRANGDLLSALQNTEEASQLGSNEPAVWYLIADLKFNLLDFAGARQALEHIQEDTSEVFEPAVLLSRLIAAELFESQPDADNPSTSQSSRWQLWSAAFDSQNNPSLSYDDVAIFAELDGHSWEKIYADLPLAELHPAELPNITVYNLVTTAPTLLYPLINACLRHKLFKAGAWLIEQLEQAFSLEPAIHLYQMKAYTYQAESAQVFDRLLVTAHAMDAQYLSVLNLTRLQDAYHVIQGISDNQQVVDYWSARGSYAFLRAAEYLQEWLSFPEPFDRSYAILQDLLDRNQQSEMAAITAEQPALAILAGLLLLPGNPEEAMEIILPHVDLLLQSTDPLQLATISLIAREAGESQLALTAIEKALEIWPDEVKWHLLAAKLNTETGVLTAAKAHLLTASRLQPENDEIHFLLGKVLLDSGDAASAIQSLKTAASINNTNPEVWQTLAAAHQMQNDPLQALASIDRAITLAPDLPGPLIVSAEISFQNRQIDQALQKADAALRISPDDPDALVIKVKALRAKSRPETALQLIEQGLKQAVHPLPLLLEKAEIIKDKQGVKAYLADMRKIAEQYPTDEKFLKGFAFALAENGQSAEALSVAQQALQQNENLMDLQILAARMLRATGQLDQALDHISHALNMDATNMDGYLEMAHIYEERRDFAKAAAVYQDAIDALPMDYRPYYFLGLAMKDSKDYLGAEDMLRRAAELSNDDVAVLRQLGAIIAINLVHRA
jgi:tetratricopeptide (TPR) repeat protein